MSREPDTINPGDPPRPRVLLLDDDADFLEICAEALERIPVHITTTTSPRHALLLLSEAEFDVAFVDQKMPEMEGVEFLERALAIDPGLSLILFTGYPTLESAIRALRLGVKDYVTKPCSGEELRETLKRVLEARGSIESTAAPKTQATDVPGLIWTSPAMRPVVDMFHRVASLISTVFITGETGTGKGVVARALHQCSHRRSQPFVTVNCGALPESLLESELFGYERGAFTGATQPRPGLIEGADNGTLFLDEITELPLSLQPKLLDVLQDRSVRTVGGREQRPVDFRLVAASNSNPEEGVASGRLRQDLYFRINVVRLHLPPLRDRREDIPLLAQHFVDELAPMSGEKVRGLDREAVAFLVRQHWPGNVRELRNVIERALPLASSPVLTAADLVTASPHRVGIVSGQGGSFSDGREEVVRTYEETYLKDLLRRAGGNVAQACRIANIPRNTFYRHLRKYSIQPEDYKKR